MKATDLSFLFVRSSTIADTMIGTGWGRLNTQGRFAGAIWMGESAIWAVFASTATSFIADAVTVEVEPRMMSTLSSSTKRRAFFTAVVGSVASSSRIHCTAVPPIVLGKTSAALRYGMPLAAFGPEKVPESPTLMSCDMTGEASIVATSVAAAAIFIMSLFPFRLIICQRLLRSVILSAALRSSSPPIRSSLRAWARLPKISRIQLSCSGAMPAKAARP